MRLIAIATQKGGVGKTTTSIEMSYHLKKAGKKVLLIDMDSQYNATILSKAQYEGVSTIYDVIVDSDLDPREAIQHTEYVDIIPSDPALEDLVENRDLMKNLKISCLDKLHSLTEYDFVLLDCAPSIGILLYVSIYVSDEVIIPLTADILGIVGLGQLQKLVAKMQSLRKGKPTVAGILITRYRGNLVTSKQVDPMIEDLAKKLNTKVFKKRIRETAAVGKAQAIPMPVGEFEPYGDTTFDYIDFAKEIMEG